VGNGAANSIAFLLSFFRLAMISGVMPLIFAPFGLGVLLLWSMRYGDAALGSKPDARIEPSLNTSATEPIPGSMDDYERAGRVISE
jgi:hypothetical protein